MTWESQDVNLSDLVDGTLSGPEWDTWLLEHPEAAAEVAIARRVRSLLLELQLASIMVPAGFEERLMARLRQDRTLLELLDFGLSGFGRTLIELINALLELLPASQPVATQAA